MNNKSFTLYSVLLLGVGCLLLAVFGLFIFARPALASMMNTPIPTPEILWSSVYVPKPTFTPPDEQVTAPTETTAAEPARPTGTPGTVLDIVNKSSQDSTIPSPEDQVPDDGRWIDVNLFEQQIYAYEGNVVVNSFIVSTGLPGTPAVTGEGSMSKCRFRICQVL